MKEVNSSIMALFLAVISFLTFLPSVSSQTTLLTSQITPEVMQNLLKIIDSNFFTSQASFTVPIKKVLRLAFHDCMDGCDGSVNLNNSDNRGLEIAVRQLNASFSSRNSDYAYLSTYLSRSDYWALVMSRALAQGIKKSGASVPYLSQIPHFVYGRGDNPNMDADINEGMMPDGRTNWTVPSGSGSHPTTVLEGITSSLPGVTQQDFVALLGLHGSGAANFHNSGFNGPWLDPDTDTDKVGNSFYNHLLGISNPNVNFHQEYSQVGNSKAEVSTSYSPPLPEQPKIQWVPQGASAGKLMLNVDMAMYLNFTVDSEGKTNAAYYAQGSAASLTDPTTQGNQYPSLSNNARLTWKFAKDNNRYLSQLLRAFFRLLSVKSEFTSGSYKQYRPQIVCQDNKPVCLGDVFLSDCGGLPLSC